MHQVRRRHILRYSMPSNRWASEWASEGMSDRASERVTFNWFSYWLKMFALRYIFEIFHKILRAKKLPEILRHSSHVGCERQRTLTVKVVGLDFMHPYTGCEISYDICHKTRIIIIVNFWKLPNFRCRHKATQELDVDLIRPWIGLDKAGSLWPRFKRTHVQLWSRWECLQCLQMTVVLERVFSEPTNSRPRYSSEKQTTTVSRCCGL